MEQRLFAFWRYDLPPYFLGGEITEITNEGCVKAKGYSGYCFKPIKILPYEIGDKIYEKIKLINAENQEKIHAIQTDNKEQIQKLIFEGT